jgi:meiotically up-regulated gene 157 (Mug157) protein
VRIWLAVITAIAVLCAADPTVTQAAELDAISKAAADYHGGSQDTGALYQQCLLTTVRNDITFASDDTTYVITGDIGAMWLRDASAQVRPYIYFADDPAVKAMLRGVIAREAKDLLVDPYANAFNRDYKVAEEKFELDSLAYPIWLAWTYWKHTGDSAAFTPEVKRAYEGALGVMELERDHSLSHYRHHALGESGVGAPVGYTGMVWTGFRPSDDPAQYGYNVPDNMFAVVALTDLADLEANVWHDDAMQSQAAEVRDGIRTAINNYAIVYSDKYGYMYAYEVDGLGHVNLMDDANVPSLLSIPYIGYEPATNAIYQNTRRFALSVDNPYYYTGAAASGEGSPHTPNGYVWPLALVMQALTSTDPMEVSTVIAQLHNSDLGDHLLHESFDPNEPAHYTRSNFAWPCSLFAELILNRVMGYAELPVANVGIATQVTARAGKRGR